jgi:hypothetical protein
MALSGKELYLGKERALLAERRKKTSLGRRAA